jgi:phosphohistidine phosphatase
LKSITLLRHAKAVPYEEGVDDHARPLNPRGRAAATAIGRERGLSLPDFVLCSSARRTRETWELIRQGWEAPPASEITDDLYMADLPDLLRRIATLPAGLESVWLIGHNPGLHDLARHFARNAPLTAAASELDRHFPTAARAVLIADADRWPDAEDASCRLAAFVLPEREDSK